MAIGIGINVKNSKEAVDFYTKVFGYTLGYHVMNDDGSFYHSELMKGDEPMMSVVEGKGSDKESIIQLGIEFSSADEVKRVFEAFVADGAKIDLAICELPWSPCAASVIDRFGVWWYFSACSHYPEDDFESKKAVWTNQ